MWELVPVPLAVVEGLPVEEAEELREIVLVPECEEVVVLVNIEANEDLVADAVNDDAEEGEIVLYWLETVVVDDRVLVAEGVKEGDPVEDPEGEEVGHTEDVEVRLREAVDVGDAVCEIVGEAVEDNETVEDTVEVAERE